MSLFPVFQSFFAERFFALFDADNSGNIEMSELMDGLKMLTKGSPKQKLKFLFDVYDVDGKEVLCGMGNTSIRNIEEAV